MPDNQYYASTEEYIFALADAMKPEYDAIGIPFDRTPVRQARLAEWRYVTTDDGRLVWERKFHELRVAPVRAEPAKEAISPEAPASVNART